MIHKSHNITNQINRSNAMERQKKKKNLLPQLL
jgi:hypothetical protein